MPDLIADLKLITTGSEKQMQVTLITTGGTIDKIYFDAASDYKIGEPQITDFLETYSVAFEYEIIPLMRKDSLEMDEQDRQLIHQAVLASDCDQIIITHGTDTMVETARVLSDIRDKAIILTGALKPAKFIGSDAVFNIGCAVAAVQTVAAGVYIAMNGKVWDAYKVRKNRAKNRFEAVTSDSSC